MRSGGRGELLRLARQLRGWTQSRTAEALGVAQAVLSRLENGLIEADVDLLRRAATAFGLPADFFTIGDPVYGPPVSVHAMLRGKKSEVSARDIDMITAELNLRLFHLTRFMESVEVRRVNDLPTLDVEEFDSVEKIAALVRAHWKVPRGPIRNLVRLVEKAGVIVGMSDFHGAPVSGVTFAAPGRPPLVLLNQTHPADRLRFTLCHEVGHLVMHRFPTADMEREAYRFASAFLLPPDEMRQAFAGRKVTLSLLASMKPEWRASMQSLLMRAKALGCVSDTQNRYLWQQISARGWRMREPAALDFEPEAPTVLPSIISAHLNDLGYSIQELAHVVRLTPAEFASLYQVDIEDKPERPRLRIVG